MRAFLAIEIEDYIKDNIDRTQQELKDIDAARINYVKSENIHLTLKFFGDIDKDKQEQISEIVKDCMDDYSQYTLKLVNIGAFRNINNPRVIWTGIKDKENRTVSLIKQLDEGFSKIGFKKEKNYTPHITIGRVKSLNNKKMLSDFLKEHHKTYFGKMQVKSICLKSSILTPEGPIYNTEEEFMLKE